MLIQERVLLGNSRSLGWGQYVIEQTNLINSLPENRWRLLRLPSNSTALASEFGKARFKSEREMHSRALSGEDEACLVAAVVINTT